MTKWLLVVSRDTELTRVLRRVLMRSGDRGQLWVVESAEKARRKIAEHESLPFAILIDELFSGVEPLVAIAEEFAWYAPLIVVAFPRRQTQLASLVAEGKVDLVTRGDYCIPLAAAVVERSLRWERETEQQMQCSGQPVVAGQMGSESDPEGFPAEALRLVGAILDNLELVLTERPRLPSGIARRLGRVADLAFDMKQGLRLLAGHPEPEDASQVGTPNHV